MTLSTYDFLSQWASNVFDTSWNPNRSVGTMDDKIGNPASWRYGSVVDASTLMILDGDIGGTKTNLGFFDVADGKLTPGNHLSFPSKRYAGLESIIDEFMSGATRLSVSAEAQGRNLHAGFHREGETLLIA